MPTPDTDRSKFCLTDEEVLTLAGFGIEVERHYGERAGHSMPMDIESAKDGLDRKLYLVQARPETCLATAEAVVREYRIHPTTEALVEGRAVAVPLPGVGFG